MKQRDTGVLWQRRWPSGAHYQLGSMNPLRVRSTYIHLGNPRPIVSTCLIPYVMGGSLAPAVLRTLQIECKILTYLGVNDGLESDIRKKKKKTKKKKEKEKGKGSQPFEI